MPACAQRDFALLSEADYAELGLAPNEAGRVEQWATQYSLHNELNRETHAQRPRLAHSTKGKAAPHTGAAAGGVTAPALPDGGVAAGLASPEAQLAELLRQLDVLQHKDALVAEHIVNPRDLCGLSSEDAVELGLSAEETERVTRWGAQYRLAQGAQSASVFE